MLEKGRLIVMLQVADDTATLDLMRLPPEHCVQVYRHHFQHLLAWQGDKVVPSKHAESALLLVSRLVRQEAGPIFYGECRFGLRFESLPQSPDGDWLEHDFDTDSAALIDWMPVAKLSAINHFGIHLRCRTHNMLSQVLLEIDIDNLRAANPISRSDAARLGMVSHLRSAGLAGAGVGSAWIAAEDCASVE